MATLYVRNVPDELVERIRGLAARERRSLTAQVTRMLEEAAAERAAAGAWFEEAKRLRDELGQRGEVTDSAALIREARAQREGGGC